jgi:glycosyltransferase involved in cell wall biosynthesis
MKTYRKRVLMFAGGGTTHASGGIGTFIQYLIQEWATTPVAPQVRVIDPRGPGGKASMGLHFPKAVGQLLYLGALGRIDLIHIHMSAYGSALRKGILILLGTMLGVPVIVHMHGSNFHKFYFNLPRPCQKALGFVLNRARFVVVLGSGWRDFLVSDLHVAQERVSVIFNGVPRPDDDGGGAESTRGESVRIVFLGQLGERKGVPDLLAALQSPRLLPKPWTATIAGDGAVEEFRAAVAKAGLNDRVILPGWVDSQAANDLLHRADIFVLPSYFEAMPIAILEALAHGVPVVATPVGAIPEFLTDGENAVLVPPGAPDQLADAIARLIDDANERRRLGAAGREIFRDRFDIRVAAERVLALYGSAMQPTGKSKAAGGSAAAHGKRTRKFLGLLNL